MRLLAENLGTRCREQKKNKPTTTTSKQQQQKKGKNKNEYENIEVNGKESHDTAVYTDDSVTRDLSGLEFAVEQNAVPEDSGVYKVPSSSGVYKVPSSSLPTGNTHRTVASLPK